MFKARAGMCDAISGERNSETVYQRSGADIERYWTIPSHSENITMYICDK